LVKNCCKNILTILLGLTLSFFLLEGLLRVFEPVEFRVKGNKIKLPRLKTYQFINNKSDKLDNVIFNSRNRLGFRGELPPPNFEKVLSIIAIGGSTTECMNISDGKTWCDILTAKLKGKFKPLWLNNAGLDGASTYGHITLMEDYIIGIGPKVVLFLVGANEIAQAGYPISDVKHLLESPDSWLGSLMGKVVNESEVLSYSRNFLRYHKAIRMGVVHEIIDFGKLKPHDMTEREISAIVQAHTKDFLESYQWRLNKLIKLAKDNSIEPVFITQPIVFGDVIDPVTGVDLGRAETYGTNGITRWLILERYNEVVRATALKHQLCLIDLARELPKSTEYYYDSHHFSNLGCQKVAAIVDQHLEPWLAEKYSQYAFSHYAQPR
jgi:hypothetical protein